MNKGGVVYARVWRMAQTTLDFSFAVKVDAPVEMPPRVYCISFHDLIVRLTPQKNDKQVIFNLLSEKVLADYNLLVEDFPIMDMFSDPVKYQPCSNVEFTLEEIPDNSKPGRLI